ncbi:Hsp70 family protein [Nocardia cyriacigeorgica]|uniref:Hsp70 family protein n=1 Tax=Nocardia cyriacigeorgica TaxID=135487 RepID=UPI001E5F1F4B|nr:Hsp70 family protein [Nocardia cyriacigeorgica]
MGSVLGVAVGACAVRLARPHAGYQHEHLAARSFDLQTVPVAEQDPAELAAQAVGVTLEASADIAAAAIAYRTDQQARALRAAMAKQQVTNYELVPELNAIVEFAERSGDIRGASMLVVYDLGSSGLSVSIVDVETRQVRHTERTSDISGDYIDSLIREQQIASGRIAHPHDPSGLAQLDALCRQAKEQLSSNTAVALPSEQGLVLLAQENFEALITLAVESSARMAREVVMRSGMPVNGVLVVGGGARIPLVARVLEHSLGLPVVVPEDPETVAARGAALLARAVRAPRPVATTAARPAPDPAFADDELAPSWLSAPTERRRGRREISGAALTVSALAVVAAIGLGLGYGPQVLERDSHTSEGNTSPLPTTPSKASAPLPQTAVPTTTEAEEAIAEPPPQRQRPDEPAPTTVGPNTIVVVPGLPPIIVPTIPPLFPPPPPG